MFSSACRRAARFDVPLQARKEGFDTGVPLAAHHERIEHDAEQAELECVLLSLLHSRATPLRGERIVVAQTPDGQRAVVEGELERAVRFPCRHSLSKPAASLDVAVPIGTDA